MVVMRTSVGPSCRAPLSPPHVVVIGNQKGGCGKSTFAMHIIVALLKAGKRVASFDLDLNQLTLTRYLGNRHEWDRKHEQNLELPDHYPVTEEVHGTNLWRFISRLKKIGRAHKDDFIGSSALSHSADLNQFISELKKIGRAHKHDFIVVDTPGGVQHLSLIVHGMADTLITPINDSLVDLDVLVAMEQSDLGPKPSVYAKMVWRALEARRKVTGRTTDWIVVRNRLESVESSNQHQITQVLEVIERTVGCRVVRGLLERPVYREFFAAGLTVLDPIEGFESAAVPARLEVQNLIREIGLIEDDFEDEAFHEIEREIAQAIAKTYDVVTDKEDLSEETTKRAVTLVPGLPTGSSSAHPAAPAVRQMRPRGFVRAPALSEAATAGRWVGNARSRRAVYPTPCARPGGRTG
jgi:chromosome partitioning protein